LGTEIFPEVDNRMFQFRLRASDGTRIEETEQVTREALRFIGERAGPGGVDISLGYVGVVPKVDPNHWTVFCRFLASEIPLGISLVPVTQA
jgi:multidrug efflux pump subunit AcrB